MLGSESKSCFDSTVILKNIADTIKSSTTKTRIVDTSAAAPLGNFNFLLKKLVNGLVNKAINKANTNGPVYESVEKNNTNNAV
jgi:hypothetical protein